MSNCDPEGETLRRLLDELQQHGGGDIGKVKDVFICLRLFINTGTELDDINLELCIQEYFGENVVDKTAAKKAAGDLLSYMREDPSRKETIKQALTAASAMTQTGHGGNPVEISRRYVEMGHSGNTEEVTHGDLDTDVKPAAIDTKKKASEDELSSIGSKSHSRCQPKQAVAGEKRNNKSINITVEEKNDADSTRWNGITQVGTVSSGLGGSDVSSTLPYYSHNDPDVPTKFVLED